MQKSPGVIFGTSRGQARLYIIADETESLMSIVDGMPRSEAEVDAAVKTVRLLLDGFCNKLELTPRQRSILDLMKEGVPLAAIFGLDKADRDSLFLLGCRFFQAGDLENALAVLTVLYQLYPLDGRVLYVLGAVKQAQGDVAAAAKIFVNSIALDATNPDGYLRIGECFLAAKEKDEAESCFRTALALCEEGHGDATSRQHAERMVSFIELNKACAI